MRNLIFGAALAISSLFGLSAEAKIIQQLRFIMVGGKHWQGLGKPSA